MFFVLFTTPVFAKKKAQQKVGFSENTISECSKAFDDYNNNPEHVSQAAMNLGSSFLSECYRHVLDKTLDIRLLELKKTDPGQFKKEMSLQKYFNVGLKKFSDFYFSKCEGSVCGSCAPANSLVSMRAEQAESLNQKSLTLASKDAPKAHVKLLKKYFSEFAKGLCELPTDVWKSKPDASKCADLLLANLAEQAKFLFRSPDNEGDVCAQL